MNDDTVNSDKDAIDSDDKLFKPQEMPRLAEDGSPPAQPANDVPGSNIPADDPHTDSDVDADEAYNEGRGVASGATDKHFESDTIEQVIEEEP